MANENNFILNNADIRGRGWYGQQGKQQKFLNVGMELSEADISCKRKIRGKSGNKIYVHCAVVSVWILKY